MAGWDEQHSVPKARHLASRPQTCTHNKRHSEDLFEGGLFLLHPMICSVASEGKHFDPGGARLKRGELTRAPVKTADGDPRG